MLGKYSMSHSFSSVYVHLIFHTKVTGSDMAEEHLPRIFQYINGVVQALSGYVYVVGGRPDHVHILTSLPATMSISDFVRTIKSNTSRWIKGTDMRYKDFSWQEGYGAFSVSESNKAAVIQYIRNQKEHHRKHTAQEEFNLFLVRHGVGGNVTTH